MTGGQAVSLRPGPGPGRAAAGDVGLAGGRLYFAGALVLGLLYLAAAVRFWRDASDLGARRLLRTSFVYLPAILLLLLLNPMPS